MSHSDAPVTRMRGLRGFTARFVNPLTRLIAPWLPGFAVVVRRRDHYYFALTYGSDVDWLKNVMSAGACDLETVGSRVHVVDPELLRDPELRFLPAPARFIERWNGVTEVLRMRAA